MAHILVVEDEWIVAEDIQRSLENSGYTVSIASSGEEAIKIAEKSDLILMDIVLKGGLDGIQAALEIHANRDTPIVFLTAYADEETLQRAKMADPHGYLVKPFEDRELYATVEMALHRYSLEKKVKESKKWLEREVKERSRRIEILLNTRQALQKEKTWENGLLIITDCVEQLGFERCSIFLVNPVKKTLDYHFGKGVDFTEDVSILLRDTDYLGARCVLEKKTVYTQEYVPKKGKLIVPESTSLAWIPIMVQNEVFAALQVSSTTREHQITEEDVKDLEILAGMCGAFIDRTRLLVEPIPEETLDTEIEHWLEPAEGYLVLEKEAEKSFEIFVDLVTHSIPGFVISRVFPEKIQKKYNLVKTPMLWLSRFEKENTISPDSISKLVYIIRDFTKKSEESVILLDGLEYLITQAGFTTVLTYLQELKDIIVMYNSRLIIPLYKEVLSSKEYKMLEKEFQVLEL
jgi:CheY-like chemotaxis protein